MVPLEQLLLLVQEFLNLEIHLHLMVDQEVVLQLLLMVRLENLHLLDPEFQKTEKRLHLVEDLLLRLLKITLILRMLLHFSLQKIMQMD